MRSPMLAASAAMDIDEISGGRMILGLGSGTKTMNENWYSTPFNDPPAPRMKDAIGLIRAAFAAQKGGGLDLRRQPYYHVKIPQFSRPGAARLDIPIAIAAVNRGMIRTAAAVANGLVGHPIYTRKYIAETVLPELRGQPVRAAAVRDHAASPTIQRRRATKRACRSRSTTRRGCIIRS